MTSLTHPRTASATTLPTTHPASVRAVARIRAEHNGHTTTLPTLHSDGPFHLRRLRPHAGQARVSIIGAMCAPLGGDNLELDITAAARSQLEVTTAAATIALRGASSTPASYQVRLTVGDDACLHWLPHPLISTHGSTLHQAYTVELATTARLLLREEQLLGRTAEAPGLLSTRLVVRHGGRPMLDQHTTYGGHTPAWDGPAVLGNHRATGQLLIVDPALRGMNLPPLLISDDSTDGSVVLTALANGPAVLATAVAPTAAQLRRLLDTAHAAINAKLL